MRRMWVVGMVGAVMLGAAKADAGTVHHEAWDRLLHRYVTDGLVNYEGLQAERVALTDYLASLAAVHPEQLQGNTEDALAFWINAYNANVVEAVLERYPIASVRTVKGFFDGLRFRVAGQALTLNQIEQQGRALGDWRIHFGVVCASSSCPVLRSEAYVPERIDEQLADQTRRFLAIPMRGLRVDGATLWVSKIFDWYSADFLPKDKGGVLRRPGAATLLEVLAPYLNDEVKASTANKKLGLKFLNYDWTLNRQTAAPPA